MPRSGSGGGQKRQQQDDDPSDAMPIGSQQQLSLRGLEEAPGEQPAERAQDKQQQKTQRTRRQRVRSERLGGGQEPWDTHPLQPAPEAAASHGAFFTTTGDASAALDRLGGGTGAAHRWGAAATASVSVDHPISGGSQQALGSDPGGMERMPSGLLPLTADTTAWAVPPPDAALGGVQPAPAPRTASLLLDNPTDLGGARVDASWADGLHAPAPGQRTGRGFPSLRAMQSRTAAAHKPPADEASSSRAWLDGLQTKQLAAATAVPAPAVASPGGDDAAGPAK